MGSIGTARLHRVGRYSAEKTNERAVSGAADRIHGGGNIHRAVCSVQSRRNKRRENNNHPGYIWKTLIFILWLLGSAMGGDTLRVWKGQALIQTARFITPDPDPWSHNKPWRTNGKLNLEMRLFSLQPLSQDQNDAKTDMEITGWSRVSRSEGGRMTEGLRLRILPRNGLSLNTRKGDIERARELTMGTEPGVLARTGEKDKSL